ncbi:MAG: helix-turn-helix domain-containing protein [Rhodanobacter sp.]
MNPPDAIQVLLMSGWTQTSIAKELGVSQPLIGRYLTGTQPNYETGLQLVAMGRKAEAKLKRQERAQA